VLDATAARWSYHPDHQQIHQGWAHHSFSDPS
jgi:hypothetical protein